MFASRAVVSAVFRQKSVFNKALASATPLFRYSDNRAKSNMTIENAKMLPKEYDEYSNEVIVTMAVMGDQGAREERLIREIMSVDEVSHESASTILEKIKESNRQGLFWQTMPYKLGIFAAVTSGLISFPLIFDYESVLWFNDRFVTCDVPEEKDLETALEVGGFAWNWMEPPLGQVSFFLLCMQYSRSQLENLGIKPFTQVFKKRRAERLHKEFPQYNEGVLHSFSEGDPLSP